MYFEGACSNAGPFVLELVMNETRLDEIETRLAHQEKTISELNDVVLGQWRRIEALERQISRMNDEMQNMDSGAVPVDRPPHY